MNKNKEIAIYKSKDGKVELQVKLEQDTVWITQQQMMELFKTSKQNVSLHTRNVFKEGELKEKQVVKESLTTASDGKQYKTKHYNLDVIISVGYRIKSKRGTEFRLWATNVLKQYLINGYALNDKRLKQLGIENVKDIKNALNVAMHAIEQRSSGSDEALSLLEVVRDYSGALDLLDRYDHGTLEITKSKLSKRKGKVLTHKEAVNVVKKLGEQFGGSTLFGKERDKSFESSVNTIYQSFGGEYLYPSIEEKAANLLYFVTKNHSFVDGNKRIAASIFLYFMDKNKVLYKKDGSRILNNNALVAITLMIAESSPKHKDAIVKMIVNLIDRRN